MWIQAECWSPTSLSTCLLLQKPDSTLQQPSEGESLTGTSFADCVLSWSCPVWLLRRSDGCTSCSSPGSTFPSRIQTHRGASLKKSHSTFWLLLNIKSSCYPMQQPDCCKVKRLVSWLKLSTCVSGQVKLSWVCVTAMSSSSSSIFSADSWLD